MFLENAFGSGYEDYYEQNIKSTINLQLENNFDSASEKLGELFKNNVTASDVKDYIDQQSDNFFKEEIKLTRGTGAFGRLF